jgi:hypothetical protein
VRVLNIRPLLDDVFREEAALPGRVEQVKFIHQHHTYVYLVHAGGDTYIAHATPGTSEYLSRVRDNLQRRQALQDDRIPRVLAWRHGGPDLPLDQRWALLVCNYLPGTELSPRTFTPQVWRDLCNLLFRVHVLPANGETQRGVTRRVDDPSAFPAFAEMLVLQLAGLPLRIERVRRHLDAMADYVHAHGQAFQIAPRLIHGDLNRSNVVIENERAAVIDWSELGTGDYAYDLAMLKFAMDSVAPRVSSELLLGLARHYRADFGDETLELRLRFFLALPGLFHAFYYASQTALFKAARAWRVRTCYLHSEAQWASPLQLDGAPVGAPAVRTEHWVSQIPPPLRGLYYVVAPKRVG